MILMGLGNRAAPFLSPCLYIIIIGDFIVAVSLSLSSSPARQRGRERPAATAAFAFSLLRDFLLFRRAGGVTGRLPRLSSGWVPFVYLPSSLSLSLLAFAGCVQRPKL